MTYSISKLKERTAVIKDNKVTDYLTGYAFIDECNHCAIIVYGERSMKFMKKYLQII